MAYVQYIEKRFSEGSLALIRVMNGIIAEYMAQGYKLTVRQLYYQLVARDVIPNTERSYKNITGIANDARLAGEMDWDAIEDRTRAFIRRSRWEDGKTLLRAAAKQFHMDAWAGQSDRVFVIIEKEALVSVLEPVCYQYDVPLLAARGYPSSSVIRDFVERDILGEQEIADGDARPVVIHLGDHDPSGIDMTRDLSERLNLFASGHEVVVHRIALTMKQIAAQKPPPNPAKVTDSRFADYARNYGTESWELDALTPQYLSRLVRDHITRHIDDGPWDERQAEIADVRERMEKVAEAFRG